MRYRYFLLLLLYGLPCFADEGFWLPFLLRQINDDLIKKGLKIPVSEIYSETEPSLKDAVVIFGGGCTGQVISPAGLVLTNHHCGFSAIQALSTVENDYLTHGYWAMNPQDELPCKGLSVTFIIRIEDVTSLILDSSLPDREEDREKHIRTVSERLVAEKTRGTHYSGFVRPFFNGNQYFLFITEVFSDIRLVGAPPSSIGNFGGDTDNWMWPRHTGDIALFRIYASQDNKPAPYSPDNVPYKPRKHFTLSLKGTREGDFTMVYGFPGRTQVYLPSFAIDLIERYQNPLRISIREARLHIMESGMKLSDTLRLKYASKQKSLSNAYKKWKGELIGIRQLNTAEKKRTFEKDFLQWAKQTGRENYLAQLKEFEKVYEQAWPYILANDYYQEAVMGIEIVSHAAGWTHWMQLPASDTAAVNKELETRKQAAVTFFKNYDVRIDMPMLSRLLMRYYQNTPDEFISPYLHQLYRKYKGDFHQLAEDIFSRSVFSSETRFHEVMSGSVARMKRKLRGDPAYRLAEALSLHFQKAVQLPLSEWQRKINRLQRWYMAAQMEMQPERKFYPDANFTLRLSYGQVKGYKPRDGVTYYYLTTLEGVMEKEDSSHEEFIVPEKLKQLYQQKDYGRYVSDNTVPVAFIANNHTAGGNSGSPVLNAYGHLIGTNFDRVWEGTMSDLHFDPDQCRNISVDIRYTLFIIDRFAGCHRILNELTIVE
jgi:hypothetical protein